MKAPDAVVNVIDFIEEQLSKSSKKSMFRCYLSAYDMKHGYVV